MTNSDRLQEIRERVATGKRLRRVELDWLLAYIDVQDWTIKHLQAISDDPKLQELENRAKGYRKQERPM